MINDVIQKKSWQKKPRFPNEVIISGLTGCVFTMRRRIKSNNFIEQSGLLI